MRPLAGIRDLILPGLRCRQKDFGPGVVADAVIDYTQDRIVVKAYNSNTNKTHSFTIDREGIESNKYVDTFKSDVDKLIADSK